MFHRQFLLISILLLCLCLSFSCEKGKNNPKSCNGKSTRRAVKLATDIAAKEIDSLTIFSNVDSLNDLDLPKVKSDDDRLDIEKNIFTLRAEVHKVSKHRDGDWKIKLTNGNDRYINCEAPNPGCEHAKDSRYFSQMETVRNWIDENNEDLEGRWVTLTGVAFVDIEHYHPRNAADNNIEIHPILDIHY
ncbi:MAG: hypothetical protein MRY83_22740 [Flavobacteriales bacterium]|nr:hypothetical protein [Flavobacteriales bacterium]